MDKGCFSFLFSMKKLYFCIVQHVLSACFSSENGQKRILSWASRSDELGNSCERDAQLVSGRSFGSRFSSRFFSICSLSYTLDSAFIVLYISLLVEKLLVYSSIFVDGFKKNRKNRILEGFGKQSVKMKVGEFFLSF